MADKAFCIVVLLTATMSMVFRGIGATNYTVGDSFGWNVPSNGVSTYSTWASGHTFHVGDVLVFNFVGNHDVASVTQSNYNSCNAGPPIILITGSPVDYVLKAAGSYYFICSQGNHCSQGQKMEVTVDATSGTTYTPATSGTTYTPPSAASAVALCIASVVLRKFVFQQGYGRI